MRYLLDTFAVVWLLSSQDARLPSDLRESIRYCEDAFFISDVVYHELRNLVHSQPTDDNRNVCVVRSYTYIPRYSYAYWRGLTALSILCE